MATKKSTNPKNEEAKSLPESSRLFRSETNKVIAGVCGGLGQYFDIDPTIIRIVFVLISIFGGSGILIYIILWLVIPSEGSDQIISQEQLRTNAKEMREKAHSFAHDIRARSSGGSKDTRPWWGLVILVLGAAFLMSNFGLFDFSEFSKLWPLALIGLGLFILFRK
jgi:phage shock protein C